MHASASKSPVGFAFPRSVRLTRAAEFTRVFRQGQRSRLRYFTLVVAPGSEHARLGLAVGRRASSRAVARNRIKRIVREVFRHTEMPPVDIVVIARGEIESVPPADLRADLRAGLSRVSR